MPSDRDIGKKEIERDALAYFLQAYERVHAEPLSLIGDAESPDFVCARPSGIVVGVELARLTRGRVELSLDRALYGRDELDPYVVQSLVLERVADKEQSRRDQYQHVVKECVLVLQLEEAAFENVQHALEQLRDALPPHGFSEIWVVDYSGLDAFGNVELYGLHPSGCFGLHERANRGAKPYG